jgi:hypothetical protein
MKRAEQLLVIALALMGPVPMYGQSSPPPKPDISLNESKKISPFPPKSVEVEVSDGLATVKWTKVPSEKVKGYDIFRIVDDGKLEKVGHTTELQFVDKTPPKGKVAYAVASVDINDNRSKPRQASAMTLQ